jgi:hypothetical protein
MAVLVGARPGLTDRDAIHHEGWAAETEPLACRGDDALAAVPEQFGEGGPPGRRLPGLDRYCRVTDRPLTVVNLVVARGGADSPHQQNHFIG